MMAWKVRGVSRSRLDDVEIAWTIVPRLKWGCDRDWCMGRGGEPGFDSGECGVSLEPAAAVVKRVFGPALRDKEILG